MTRRETFDELGTSDDPVGLGHLTELSVGGGATISDLVGTNLSITGGKLDATDTDTQLDPSTIGATDLGFDPTTQSELNSHAGNANAHHSPTSDTQAYSLAASGSTTLSSGGGMVDTGVATDSGHYDVNFNPGSADIALSLDGSGANYVIHIEENTTSVGNPTVGWQLVRSEL